MILSARRIRILPALALCSVNWLFACKYLSRVTAYPLVAGSLYVALLFLLLLLYDHVPDIYVQRRFRYGFLLACAIAGVVVLHFLPVESVRVDRWDIVRRFLDAVLRGEFPYAIRSMHNNPPGPLPVYFLLNFPFYLIQEIGYSTILALFAYNWLLEKHIASERARTLIVVLLTTSPAFLWELAVRSTLFGNVAVVLFYAHFAERMRLECSRRRAMLCGFCGGLVLSTRGVFVLPLTAAYSSLFIKPHKWMEGVLYGVALLAGFALTLAPFAIWDWNAFRNFNPIILEGSFMPLPVLALLLLWSVLGGIWSSSLTEQNRYLGTILFCAVSISFFQFVLRFGWAQAFWQSRFDLSYYMLALPYLMYGLHKEGAAPSSSIQR
jgi:hypothetical protein